MMKQVLTAGAAIIGLTSLFSATSLADIRSTPKKDDTALLFVQAAKSATLTPVDAKKGIYSLKLQEAEPFVSYFTDAPKRVSGQMQLDEFYRNWQKGVKSKSDYTPNAAMQSVDVATKVHVNRVFELNAPSYDAKAHTVTYKATLVGEQGLPQAALNLGYTELFIDDFHWDGNKFHRSGG